ncbi:MAG: MBL fold metallo-hydrolase [Candidatus Thorarchaeota archaeon]
MRLKDIHRLIQVTVSTTDIKIREITSRVTLAYYEEFYKLNAAAIALDNFIVVVDALYYPSQGSKFREYLETKYNLPIRNLFITHYHGDHVLAMSAFRGIEVVGTEWLRESMKRRIENHWTKKAFDNWKIENPELADEIDEIKIWLPDKTFKDFYVIEDGNLRVELYRSGGHTRCSAFAYFPEDKILFAGDEIAAKEWPYISDETGNPDDYISALEQMMKLEVDIVIPGHGPTIGKDHIKEYLSFISKLRDLVIAAVEENRRPEDIEVPDFYEPAVDWQIEKALSFMYNFYKS